GPAPMRARRRRRRDLARAGERRLPSGTAHLESASPSRPSPGAYGCRRFFRFVSGSLPAFSEASVGVPEARRLDGSGNASGEVPTEPGSEDRPVPPHLGAAARDRAPDRQRLRPLGASDARRALARGVDPPAAVTRSPSRTRRKIRRPEERAMSCGRSLSHRLVRYFGASLLVVGGRPRPPPPPAPPEPQPRPQADPPPRPPPRAPG